MLSQYEDKADKNQNLGIPAPYTEGENLSEELNISWTQGNMERTR